MSSIAPIVGKLSQIFPPRNLVFLSACLFGVGGFVTSRAKSFAVFLVGRVISGTGAAGILTISIILVLELTGKKKRGLFIGLLNAGYTSGVAFGAVIAGALVSTTGWVSFPKALLHSGTNASIEGIVLDTNSTGDRRWNWRLLQHPKVLRVRN